MPPIKCEKGVLDERAQLVIPSVVSVNTYQTHDYHSLDFATGFIIYSDERMTLISISGSFVKEKEKAHIFVHFSDGAIKKAKVFLDDTPSGHVVLKTETDGTIRPSVSFRQSAAEREYVFTVAEIEGGYSGFNFITGTICCPCCEATKLSGSMVPGSKDIFAMTCAVPTFPHSPEAKNQLIGAAVFGLTDGAVIGTIKNFDEGAYDLKYASQSYCWVNQLEKLLKDKDEKVELKKVSPNNSRKVEKRKHTEEPFQEDEEGQVGEDTEE